MKNLSIVWLSLCLSTLCATDTSPVYYEIPTTTITHIKESAQAWATACAPLSATHKELLANVLYLSYRHAYLDEQTTKAFIAMKKTFPLVRTQLRNYDTLANTIGTFLQINKRFFTFYALRHHMYLTWQQCTHHVEAIDDVLLQDLFDQLRNYGQIIIAEYVASCNIPSIAIPPIQHHIQNTINQLHALEFVIETVVEKTNSDTQSSDTIIDFDRLSHISNRIQSITDTMHQSLELIDYYQANLLAMSTQLFYEYYAALYSSLSIGNQRLLFGPHGMSTEQNQYQLPSPDLLHKNF